MLAQYEGIEEYIGGVTADAVTWPFQIIEDGLANGNILDVGSSYAPDYELIQELNPEIAFVYTGTSAQTDLIAKFEELGIPYAVDNEYMENEHTGRMEWTKFLAAFFNKDEEAVAYVDKQLSDLAEMEAIVTEADLDKPKVA